MIDADVGAQPTVGSATKADGCGHISRLSELWGAASKQGSSVAFTSSPALSSLSISESSRPLCSTERIAGATQRNLFLRKPKPN